MQIWNFLTPPPLANTPIEQNDSLSPPPLWVMSFLMLPYLVMETQNDDIPGPEWSKAQGKDPDKNAN